ncbi:hypothetical protein V0R48_03295 [Pseudomonas alcaligenes]|uniref:hypothetical protein n=1 Tax=Aquipseudomonas alcaligenes TaxID=43263 RepID=UPI002E7AD2DB|nr:hypothetical protein [Pseudomonas alcaligenes]MEE1947984.1 hypothetical protein [Pseudomonas alcaligenes]
MNIYCYKMSRYLQDNVFSPCRGKAALIVRFSEIMAELCYASEVERRDANLFIVIGKFQRLFIVGDRKIFSIQFPLSISRAEDGNGPNTFFLDGIPIDSYTISRVSTIVNHNFQDIDSDVYSLAENVLTEHSAVPNIGTQTYQEVVWRLLKRLLLLEDGYIRYDHDPENADPEMHPLHHLDIFYSPECTFKIGLDKGIGHTHFIDILDASTKCRSIAV